MFDRTPQPAPLPLRALARTIDVMLALGPIAVGVTLALRRSRTGGDDDPEGPGRPSLLQRAEWMRHRPARNGFSALGLALELGHRTHRTPGEWLVGLRTVDGSTGTAPSVSSAVRRWVLTAVRSRVMRAAMERLSRREKQRLSASDVPSLTAQLPSEQKGSAITLTPFMLMIAVTALGQLVSSRRRAAGHPPARVLIRDR